MERNIRYTKRPTKKLQEVIDNDLLTATERLIKGSIGGFYALSDESAYYKVAGEKAGMSISQFEKKLKTELHPNFFVVYNPNLTLDEKVEGHQIGFYVPEYSGFVPLCKVGRSGDKYIPANSVGKVVKTLKKNQYGEKETAMIYRGYVAAFEAAKAFILDAQTEGIKPSRTITANEFFYYKKIAEEIGGDAKLSAAFEEGRKLAEEHAKKVEEEQLEATKNVETFINDVVEAQKEEIKKEEVSDVI